MRSKSAYSNKENRPTIHIELERVEMDNEEDLGIREDGDGGESDFEEADIIGDDEGGTLDGGLLHSQVAWRGGDKGSTEYYLWKLQQAKRNLHQPLGIFGSIAQEPMRVEYNGSNFPGDVEMMPDERINGGEGSETRNPPPTPTRPYSAGARLNTKSGGVAGRPNSAGGVARPKSAAGGSMRPKSAAGESERPSSAGARHRTATSPLPTKYQPRICSALPLHVRNLMARQHELEKEIVQNRRPASAIMTRKEMAERQRRLQQEGGEVGGGGGGGGTGMPYASFRPQSAKSLSGVYQGRTTRDPYTVKQVKKLSARKQAWGMQGEDDPRSHLYIGGPSSRPESAFHDRHSKCMEEKGGRGGGSGGLLAPGHTFAHAPARPQSACDVYLQLQRQREREREREGEVEEMEGDVWEEELEGFQLEEKDNMSRIQRYIDCHRPASAIGIARQVCISVCAW
jgi:hypothetical protein